jgi:hypothetical protein
MKMRAISLIATTALFLTFGAVSSTSAQAGTRFSGSSSYVSPILAQPNFFPPTEGGGSSGSPTKPSDGSAGRQFCYAVRVVTGFTTVWLIFGNVTKPLQVAVYGTEWICTMVYG